MGSPGGNNGAPSFKPVPPPKPKNYRPPMQAGAALGGQWEGGVSISAQQIIYHPNELAQLKTNQNLFFIRILHGHQTVFTIHHHHIITICSKICKDHQTEWEVVRQCIQIIDSMEWVMVTKANNHHTCHVTQWRPLMDTTMEATTVKTTCHVLLLWVSSNYKLKLTDNQYIHHFLAVPPHPAERHALDLAGSREQRGSAFELYRKPQVGAVGHHHNLR